MIETEEQFKKPDIVVEKPKNEEAEKVEKPDKIQQEEIIIKDRIELDSAELAEDEERLREIDALEKRTGLNLDKTQEELSAEIEILEEKVDAEISDFHSGNNPEKEKEKSNQTGDELKKQAFECVEKVRNELIQHFGSQEFLDRLTIEYKGDGERAKIVQASDIENLKTVIVDILPLAEVMDKSTAMANNAGGEPLAAFYQPNIHKVTVPKDFDNVVRNINMSRETQIKNSMEDLIRHEFIHSATKANVSESARKILESSYKKQGFLGLVKNKEDEYFSDPAEMLDRKQLLDRELEKLGIKDYGIEFTEEHYEKILKALDEKKFSEGAKEFIEKTEKSYFIRIMNGIAENEYRDKNSAIEQV